MQSRGYLVPAPLALFLFFFYFYILNEQLEFSVVLVKLLETFIIVSLDENLQFPKETFNCEFREADIGS